MGEGGEQGGAINLNADDLNALLNKMLRDLALNQQRFAQQNTGTGTPAVYSFTIKMSQNGIEVVNPQQTPAEPVQPSIGNREPLVDVIENPDAITVIAEVPGVSKSDIIIASGPQRLSIKAGAKERSYSKTVELPSPIDRDSARAVYNNGVHEIQLKKAPAHSDKDDDKGNGGERKISVL